MLALAYPWILAFLFLTTIICFVKNRKIFSVFLFLLCILLNWWAQCLPVHFSHLFKTSEDGSLTVMCYNVAGSSENIKRRIPGIIDIVVRHNPDILFVAELPNEEEGLNSELCKIYPYTSFETGYWNCFYSKYPLGEQVRLMNGNNGVGVYKCKIDLDSICCVLYGCHFASNNYTQEQKYLTPDSISNHYDLIKYFGDIQLAYGLRNMEAELLVEDYINERCPAIIMGDFNDVGGSSVIRSLEEIGFIEAWWHGGFGYGATIHSPLPYRIDHIMFSNELDLNLIRVIDSNGLSDHNALYAVFN